MTLNPRPTRIGGFLADLEERYCRRGIWRRRRAHILDAAARSFCAVSERPGRNGPARRYLKREDWTEPLVNTHHPRREVYERIKKGGLEIDGDLAIWDSGHWHGLRLSGALRRGPASSTEWYVWERAHPALVADLAEMTIPGRLEPRPSVSGLRRLRRCPASFLPPENPKSPSVLAGLFSGAAIREVAGETWMELPAVDEIRTILGDWRINFTIAIGAFRKGRHGLRVSPFYAALFAHLMPAHSAERILSVRRAALCPLLSVAHYELVLSRRFARYMPHADALPFGCSKATFMRRGWRRRDLKRMAMVDMHIWLTDGLRDQIVRWYEAHRREPVPAFVLPASV